MNTYKCWITKSDSKLAYWIVESINYSIADLWSEFQKIDCELSQTQKSVCYNGREVRFTGLAHLCLSKTSKTVEKWDRLQRSQGHSLASGRDDLV